jgi:hypothetical protein
MMPRFDKDMPAIPTRGGGAGGPSTGSGQGAGRGGANGPTAEAHVFAAAKGKPLTVAAPGLARGTGGTTIAIDTPPSHGKVTIQANGAFTYTPTGDFIGIDTFTFKMTSTGAGASTGTVTINVK